jgi:hypothetical protein
MTPKMDAATKREFNRRRGRAISHAMMKKFAGKNPSEAKRARRRVVDAVGSERELARLLGCSYSSIGEYFRGETPIPADLDATFRLLFPALTWWKWPGGVAR